MKELDDLRILGAVRFADAVTQTTVMAPLVTDFRPLKTIRNTSGFYVLLRAPGMESYTNTFDVTGVTPPTSATFTISVSDPARQYLPRLASVTVPRSTTVPNSDVSSVFQPQAVALYPAPSAAARATWATVFVEIVSAAAPNPSLPWVLLQVQNADDSTPLATAMGDDRGQAQIVLPLPGIRANSAGGAVITTTTNIKIIAIYDPKTPDPNVPPGNSFVPNPDDMIAHSSDPSMKQASVTLPIAAGQTQAKQIQISLA
jgi:hypothetical protein